MCKETDMRWSVIKIQEMKNDGRDKLHPATTKSKTRLLTSFHTIYVSSPSEPRKKERKTRKQ